MMDEELQYTTTREIWLPGSVAEAFTFWHDYQSSQENGYVAVKIASSSSIRSIYNNMSPTHRVLVVLRIVRVSLHTERHVMCE